MHRIAIYPCGVERPLVIGHRGASGYRPEHTRAAYELAFALGADAVEPDIVATKDGVLVLRHENEISGTTDVASRPEFAARRTTKVIDGDSLTGWFTEDFTWAELSTLRAIERLPSVRPNSVTFDGMQPVLRLRDLMDIIDAASTAQGRQLIMVAEIKHATYFASIGLPLDELFAAEIAGLGDRRQPHHASRSSRPCSCRSASAGCRGGSCSSPRRPGRRPISWRGSGRRAIPYSAHLTNAGLARLAADGVDGVSVDKALLLRVDANGTVLGTTDLVDRAHAAGLEVYTWTLRAENRFLASNLRRGRSPRDYGNWSTEFDLLLGTGLDGVFADQPDLAVARARAGGPQGGSLLAAQGRDIRLWNSGRRHTPCWSRAGGYDGDRDRRGARAARTGAPDHRSLPRSVTAMAIPSISWVLAAIALALTLVHALPLVGDLSRALPPRVPSSTHRSRAC